MAGQQINFRVGDETAVALRRLAEIEGGFPALAESIARAADLTRKARDGERFTTWLAGHAQSDHDHPGGPPSAAEAEAARAADLAKARAEGFAAGQKSAATERDRRLDSQWANLERQQKAHAAQVGLDRHLIADEREQAEALRREIARQLHNFETEAHEAAEVWAAGVQQRRDTRAQAEERLREEGRRDLAGTLADMDRTGKQSRAVLALVRQAAATLVDEQLDGKTATPAIALDIAAKLVAKSSEVLGNPALEGIELPTDEGPKQFDLVLKHQTGRQLVQLKARLANLGVVLEYIANASPITLDDLPAPEATELPEEEPLALPQVAGYVPEVLPTQLDADEPREHLPRRRPLPPMTPEQAAKREKLLAMLAAQDEWEAEHLDDAVTRAMQSSRALAVGGGTQ